MVSFAAEPLFFIGPFPFTNTLLDTFIVDGLILGGIYALNKHFNRIPGYFQNMFEMMTETFYELTQSISPRHAAKIFPYLMTFFLFVLLANWSGLIPGFGTLGFKEHGQLIPLLRGAGSDINFTLGLALVSVIATHAMSIQVLGIKEYLSRYFSLNPIYLFVGVLEIVSEITKIISLSFRLFVIYSQEKWYYQQSQIYLPLLFRFPFCFWKSLSA